MSEVITCGRYKPCYVNHMIYTAVDLVKAGLWPLVVIVACSYAFPLIQAILDK